MKFKIFKFKKVKSTNSTAMRIIQNTQCKYGMIISDSQINGRGQYGRKWTSYRGNIFISIYFILRKKITIKTFSRKIYTTIKKSLQKFVNEKITIKLPNDLLIRGSKVCGILQETITHNKNRYFIVGIGINLIKSPKIENKQVSFLQKYNNNKIHKSDICKKIKKNFEKFI